MTDLRVNAADDISCGVYANIVNVTKGPEEVILDFLLKPSEHLAYLVARVTIHPQHAERLAEVLAQKPSNLIVTAPLAS